MLYEVLLWVEPTNYEAPDIKCRVNTSSFEQAVMLALRVNNLTRAAFVSVRILDPVTSGTIERLWGPVEYAALAAECGVFYG